MSAAHHQARVYAACGGFRHTVNRVRVLASHPDFDNARIILDQLAHGFAAQAPHLGKFPDAVVFLESGVINQHGNLITRRTVPDGGREQKVSAWPSVRRSNLSLRKAGDH